MPRLCSLSSNRDGMLLNHKAMDNNCLSSPLVGRSLLPPVAALCYLFHTVLTHVVFVQPCQKRPMDINACSLSMPLPHIRHSMNIAYPSIRSLPTPYGLILCAFSYGQATVLAICLWFPHLWFECNATSLSSLHFLAQCSMSPSPLPHLLLEHNTMLPSSM